MPGAPSTPRARGARALLQVRSKIAARHDIKVILGNVALEPNEVNGLFEKMGSASIQERQKLEKILLRPGIQLKDLMRELPKVKEALDSFERDHLEQAEIQVKYAVYLNKEKELVERMSQMEGLAIPKQFDYQKIQSLSAEAREKLIRIRPETLGQASRISGINPSDVQILMVYMGR